MYATVAYTIRQHVSLVRNNPVAISLAFCTFFVVLYNGYISHTVLHGIGYLFAVWFGAFITDIVVNARPKAAIGFPIKRPVWREVALIFISLLLGTAFLCIRFFGGWETMQGIVKLAVLPLILFTFPVVLAIIYLFVYKYKLGK